MKKKYKKRRHDDDVDAEQGQPGKVHSKIEGQENLNNEDNGDLAGKETGEKDLGAAVGNNKHKNKVEKNKMKKANSCTTGSDSRVQKKVSFSDHVDVFDDIVHGKQFTKDEDKLLIDAVSNYIEVHGLGEEGLNMVLHSKSYPEVKNCWKDICGAIPWRPLERVSHRAHALFKRNKKHTCPEGDYKLARKHVEKCGPATTLKELSDTLGKHGMHVKDAWHTRKLEKRKRGQCSQEEYQTLFDLVSVDLRMKAFDEMESKHGMLQDSICWADISDKLSKRKFSSCSTQWYNHLTSSMVVEGKWADADDYRLLGVLSSLDACCIEDVDWDNLLEHRSGDICRKRWGQMVQHIGHHGCKSFSEQVEILANRYS